MESKFLDIINSLKNIPKTFLWMLAFLPWVLSIPYLQKIIPPLSKYMEESPTVIPIMWIVSIASTLLLFFEICVVIFNKLQEHKVQKKENQCIENEKIELQHIENEKLKEAERIRLAEEKAQEQKNNEAKLKAENDLRQQLIAEEIRKQKQLEDIIMSFINMSNDAKIMLCNLYEKYQRGDTFMYSHGNKTRTAVLNELYKIQFLQRTYIDNDRNGMNYKYLINPIYYDFFKNNPILYSRVKNSIP